MPGPIPAAAPRAMVPTFLQANAPATPAAPAYRQDAWAGARAGGTASGPWAPAQAGATANGPWAPAQAGGTAVGAAAIADGGFLGWLGGCLAGAFWALPKLARFGPAGLLGSVVVILGCGWYGGRVVASVKELFAGSVHGVAQLGAWFVGGRLAAGAIAGMKQPGVLMAAFVIWLGSWAAGKLLDMVWPGGRT